MISFKKEDSLRNFQTIISDIYSIPDDRFFSLASLVANQSRFTMRALKGIRKKDKTKLAYNLMVSFAWTMAICNRLHIDIEDMLWGHFPFYCSYCGNCPCLCKKVKVKKRVRIVNKLELKPNSLADFQDMFESIYPSGERTLADAGVHLAEEVGEVHEAIDLYQGQHKDTQFDFVTLELADWVSCMFGVANSAKINVSKKLEKMFCNNCHICHQAPCICNYGSVARFKS